MKKLPTLLFSFLAFFALPISANAAFQDVSAGHANSTAIDFVQNEGIVAGYSDGNFRPDATINRAELTKIIVESQFSDAEIENCISENNSFPDVKNSDWFAKYICLAKNKNVVAGYSDGNFRPADSVNFAESAKIISGAFGFETGENEIWYRPFVEQLANRKAIPTTIASFEKNITRGEMAEMIWRLKSENLGEESVDFDGIMGVGKVNEIIYNEETGNYERTIFESVGKYEIVKRGDFDFIEIKDDEYDQRSSGGYAGLFLPTKRFEIDLSGGTIVENVEIVAKNPIELGKLNIPKDNLCNDDGSDCEIYLEAPDSIGLSDEMYSYFTYESPDEVELNINLLPITYDTMTDEATLFKDIEIKIEYKTEKQGVLLQASPRKQNYEVGEIIDVFVLLENVVDRSVNFEVTVELRGFLEKVVQTKKTTVSVNPAELKQISVHLEAFAPDDRNTYGSSWVVTSVSDGQNVIGASREHININTEAD